MRILAVALIGLVLTAGGCAGMDSGDARSGPQANEPSAEAQQAMKELTGRRFEDPTGALGAGEWTVHSYARVANPVSNEGPVVVLTRPGAASRYVPVFTDGDAADFWLRVTGRPHPSLKGDTSEPYRRIVPPR